MSGLLLLCDYELISLNASSKLFLVSSLTYSIWADMFANFEGNSDEREDTLSVRE